MFFKMSFPDIPKKDTKEFIMSIYKQADDGLSLVDILLSSERSIGVAEGIVKGEAIGVIKGARKATREMVTNILKSRAMDTAQLAAVSGMKEDDVLALQAKLGL
jgi:hypothetical protein